MGHKVFYWGLLQASSIMTTVHLRDKEALDFEQMSHRNTAE
jgi:hypothetical protein